MVTVKLYVEGGGDTHPLRSKCREGFRKFLEKAGFTGKLPRIVACGSRQSAYDHFRTACESNEIAMLLIDSEDLVSADSPWEHLAHRPGDGFTKPPNATDDHCHLMVVCMESWFLADKEALSRFFGHGFNENVLPRNPNIESILKSELFSALAKATAHCRPREQYGKGKHSFDILIAISPAMVANSSPWAKRFLDKLKEFTELVKT